jgi:hypothetical protein
LPRFSHTRGRAKLAGGGCGPRDQTRSGNGLERDSVGLNRKDGIPKGEEF